MNVQRDAQGGITVANMNPASETIGKQFEDLQKMEEVANASRLAKYQASLLRQKINDIGTSGPLTEHLGELAALAKQLNVPDKTLAAFNLQPASIQEANAVALGLLGESLRATFPNRITNTDISTFKPSSPGVNLLSDATNYLLDKIVLPKNQRDIERYGFATTLPQNDPQKFKSELYKWDQDHSYESYVKSEQSAGPKRLIFNPQTQTLEPAKP